jgi:ComEC/Rec2-like protein
MFFLLFLSFIIGILSGIYSVLILLIYFPLFFLLLKRKTQKKQIYWTIAFLILGFVLAFFFPKGSTSSKEMMGIVTRSRDNYFLLLTWRGKYYVKCKDNNISLFSLVKMKGNVTPLSFYHYESGFDFEDYLHSQGTFFEIKGTCDIIFQNPIHFDPWKNVIFSYADKESKLIYASLLFGESLYELENYNSLYMLNLIQTFALSGFHLSFLFRFIEKAISEKHTLKFILVKLLVLSFFLIISNFKFAIRRILLLEIIRLFLLMRQIKVSYLNQVSLTGIILLFFEPYQIISPAFYYAFPFLLYLGITQKTNKEMNKGRSLWFSIEIYFFFLPLFLKRNYYVSLLSLPIQLLSFPLTHFIFLASLSLFFLPQAALFLNKAIHFSLSIFEQINLEETMLVSGDIPLYFIFSYYLFFLTIKVMKNYNLRNKANRLIVINTVISSLIFIPDFKQHYEIVFIDVDQGDATLIRYKNKNILIDTGGKTNVDIAVECLIPFFRKNKIKSLDAVIITHLDYDHYGALESLQNHFSIGDVFYREDFLSSIDNTLNISGIQIKNYNKYFLDDADENVISGVYGFQILNYKILIMGDAPKSIERKIMVDNPQLHADILKIGHHGSNTSSDYEFLARLQPDLSIISCGKNNFYHHPNKETISTLEQLNLKYLRTDYEGSISLDFSHLNLDILS